MIVDADLESVRHPPRPRGPGLPLPDGSVTSGGSDSSGSAGPRVVTADMHLREVEQQLQNIFTPTPVELLRVTLHRQHTSDSFGFGLSDGVYEKGVYISAVQPGSPADVQGRIRPYDRLLQVGPPACRVVWAVVLGVNCVIVVFQVDHVRTKDLDCHQVVPLIARSGLKVHLVLSRNPLATTPTTTPTSSPLSTLQSARRAPAPRPHLSPAKAPPPPKPVRTSSQSKDSVRRRPADHDQDSDQVWQPQLDAGHR